MLKYICHCLLLTSIIFLMSCEAPEPNTRLDFASGNSLTTSKRTVPAGELITSSLYARTASADVKFKRITITYDYDSSGTAVTYLDSVLNSSDFGLYFTFSARGVAGTETWNFTITDDKDSTYTKNYTLTTTSDNNQRAFNLFSTAFYKQTPFRNLQYFAAKYGTVYPGYVARQSTTLKPDVDFFFEIDDPQQNTLSVRAPESNITTFKTTALTRTEFDQVASVAALTDVYNTGAVVATNRIDNLKKDQVIAFKTATSKIGLIRLDSMQVLTDKTNNTRYYRMPYLVKVEKP